MGTRAIIGYINKDGSIIGGWQWFNGDNLAPVLRQQFNSLEKVQELVKYATWNHLVTPRFVKNSEYTNAGTDKVAVTVGKCLMIREKLHKRWMPINNPNIKQTEKGLFFSDLLTAYGQDISCLYIFNPQTNKWKTFSGRNYKNLEEKLKNISKYDIINCIETL